MMSNDFVSYLLSFVLISEFVLKWFLFTHFQINCYKQMNTSYNLLVHEFFLMEITKLFETVWFIFDFVHEHETEYPNL